jgi:hypothetical protein
MLTYPAPTMRRALNKRLQLVGWQNFGRLLVRKLQSRFLQFGRAEGAPRKLKGRAAYAFRVFDSKAKSMIL